MNPVIEWLTDRWLSGAALLATGLLVGWLFLAYQRRQAWSLSIGVFAAAFGLLAVGGFAIPSTLGVWLAVVATLVLAGMFLLVVLTGHWWAPGAWTAAGVLLLGLAGWYTVSAGESLAELGKTLSNARAVRPAWLLLLGFIPVIILMSFRSLAGLGPVRRWVVIGLRCTLFALLVLALSDLRLTQPNDRVTLLFLVDRSLSIPPEYDAGDSLLPGEQPVDYRWERIKRFVNESVAHRGRGHQRDKAGLILFGRRPRLELPPSDAPVFSQDQGGQTGRRYRFLDDFAGNIDSTHTDIAAAIKLALASFPEGSSKRIVLISDGNENRGRTEQQARIARFNGVEIDVVPLAAGTRNEDEVLIERIEAPSRTEKGTRFPIRVLIRNYNRHPVAGTLILRQIAGGKTRVVLNQKLKDPLLPGLNSITIPPPDALPEGSYTYEAIFQPAGIPLRDGTTRPLVADRPQNNRATTHVLALGQRKVLFVESNAGGQENLIAHLQGLGKSKFRVVPVSVEDLPAETAALNVFLSNFDCVILANVPAEQLSVDQQEIIRSNTYDQGCGLIMIGGPEGFGAGGWQNTAVEKALPVDCDIKALKVKGKGGLVLLMHASEMADGNRWQKQIGKLAIDKLGPVDMVGVLHWDLTGTAWHVPFQTVGNKKSALKRLVDRMTPGDMPEFDTALQMAYKALTNPAHQLTRRHMIIISDGDPQQTNLGVIQQMKAKKVTVATVGVATHGAPEKRQLSRIATATGGKYYDVRNPRLLPKIYTQEARLVSQSFVSERTFVPRLADRSGPTQQMPKALQPLHGFVRTTPKPSPLVNLPILGPVQGNHQFPILAYWQYGLGKGVAFTSDARSGLGKLGWDRDWAGSDMYLRFWEQVVDYSLRAVESGKLIIRTEFRDGKAKVIVEARDKQNEPLVDLKLVGRVTPPAGAAGRATDLKLEQKNAGVYEGEFKAEEAGSYFINVQAVRKAIQDINGKKVEVLEPFDSARSGITIPYSPEFADMETNAPLLEQVRLITGGKSYGDTDAELNTAARSGELFRAGPTQSRSMQPIWYWLVLAASIFFFFDIAVRRIAVNPSEVSESASRLWTRIRGRTAIEEATPQFLDRLKSRKAQVSEELDKARAATRFEPPAESALPEVAAADSAPLPSRPTTTPTTPAQKLAPEQEPENYADRLMRAKKQAMEDRDKKP